MRTALCILLLSGTLTIAHSQGSVRIDSFSQIHSPVISDSLRRLLSASKEDSNRVLLLHQVYYPVLFSRPDSAMFFAQEGLKLAQQINFPKGEALCRTDVGGVWWIIGEYSKATEVMLESLQIAESLKDSLAMAWTLAFLASNYRDQGDPNEALKYATRGPLVAQRRG